MTIVLRSNWYNQCHWCISETLSQWLLASFRTLCLLSFCSTVCMIKMLNLGKRIIRFENQMWHIYLVDYTTWYATNALKAFMLNSTKSNKVIYRNENLLKLIDSMIAFKWDKIKISGKYSGILITNLYSTQRKTMSSSAHFLLLNIKRAFSEEKLWGRSFFCLKRNPKPPQIYQFHTK